ncbi:MAG: tyrosine-type recombinase/integrase [Lentisphaerae bacterium]|nr:tyrosine-type recombinase/integrase [Lentisphaerota bacterium]
MTTIRISESATNGQSDTDRRRLIAVLNAFLGALETRGQSPATLRTRRDGLRRFSEFMERHGIERLQELTSGSLLSYAHELRARELSDNTISCYLRSTRQLLAWLVSRGELFENPAAGVPMPRRDKVVLRVPSREQVLRLLQQPDTETPLGIRNRALLEFFYGSGARLAEAVGVDVRDLDLVAGTVRIRGKGARERIIPLSRPARQWIDRYLSGARSELLSLFSPHDALWISYRGNRLGREAVDCLLRKCSVSAGIIPGIAPHALRRAMATHMLQNGANPVVIQQILGHSSLCHLSQYLQLTITDLHAMHRKSLPGA